MLRRPETPRRALLAAALCVVAPARGWAQPAEAPPEAVDPDSQDRVILEAPRAVVDVAAPRPVIVLTVTARSRLPVGVTAIDVGILLAGDAADLEDVEPALLYSGRQERSEVGVYRRVTPVEVEPGGEVELRFEMALTDLESPPSAFQTHVLDYQLERADGPLLFDLLGGRAAADERAAVGAVGLTGDSGAAWAARIRLADDAALQREMLAHVAAPLPPAPNADETIERVFAVRALGVLGGDAARDALAELAAGPGLAAFDEPLQVLRAARLTSSRLEAPVAYLVPMDARVMADVVAAALADVDGLEPPPPPDEPASLGSGDADPWAKEPVVVQPAQPPPWGGVSFLRSPASVLIAVGVGLFTFLGVWLALRWREPPS